MTARTPAGRSERRRMRTVLACGLAGAVAIVAALAGDLQPARRDRNDPEAVRLLRSAADAAVRVRYEGTQFLTTRNASGSATQRVRVEHTPGDGTYFDPDLSIPVAAGLRAVEGGRTYQPDTLPVWGGSVGFTAEILSLLVRNYTVVRGPHAVVCGRRARMVEALRVDGSAAGRFWIDSDTGLMLHRELLDQGGRTVTAAGFSELRVSRTEQDGDDRPLTMTATAPAAPPAASASPSAAPPTAAPWSDRLEHRELAVLRDQGWPVPGALPGRLTLYDARRPGPEKEGRGRSVARAGDDVVHLSYSDGLAAVSVFVQRGSLDESRFSGWRRTVVRGRAVYRRDALQHWAVWARDGYVYTLLTDAPPGTADSVVRALPQEEDAVRARMGRGFRRLVSWVNPFG
ncbi:hypothetical protein GCM10023085_26490 [Actinomadura viridis]|uniref:Sigma-E factor negative regulatory protein RseB n=1 Tax=Actinomadura viridis TaxID=58110 RepID=A0A931GPF9_9ACTN|nr:sigma-E factor regulatory protein RseB domain-containing protein [Actinomadura viridis]MBG6087364.1 sigma-E factor negative regulatory protein RseB [Actinomadura viridis]